MNIQQKYIIRIEVNNSFLTYTGKIVSEDSNFITFTDKFGKEYTYNKNNIISFEGVKE